jgi:hypothetical protein
LEEEIGRLRAEPVFIDLAIDIRGMEDDGKCPVCKNWRLGK